MEKLYLLALLAAGILAYHYGYWFFIIVGAASAAVFFGGMAYLFCICWRTLRAQRETR